jgi:MtfA peptidase
MGAPAYDSLGPAEEGLVSERGCPAVLGTGRMKHNPHGDKKRYSRDMRFFEQLFSRLKRKQPLVELTEADWRRLCEAQPCLARLSPELLAELRAAAAAFLRDKEFHEEGAGLAGTAGTELRWTVAALSALPVLRLGLAAYGSFHDILLTRGQTRVRQLRDEGGGVVTEYDDEISGEVSPWGPVVLSAEDLLSTGQGYNVVIHEMAHKLDLSNGAFDGCPKLPPGLTEEWESAYRAAWDDFNRRLKSPRERRKLPMDDYAADSPEEFFAVTVEEFFDRPFHLKRVYPAVYAVLVSYFRFDPEA